MNKPIYLLVLLMLTACQPVQDHEIFDDVKSVNQALWVVEGNVKPYPFTVNYGNIACTTNEVYFFPDDTVDDESQIGLPLNKLAELSLKKNKTQPTVKKTIKPDAGLSEAIIMGLNICKKIDQQ